MAKGINSRKIINDPLYGFISIENNLVLELIKHKSFQRLRRIRQLGFTEYVYPGAVHSRFHHALGAMHLMRLTLDVLIAKNIHISKEEYEATLVAILLHDIGHGPLSHTLENTLLDKVRHEDISLLIMEKLDKEFDGKLGLAIKIFKGDYNRSFLNQLVSGHFDIDRMDYLKRDSFYTAVPEGNIGVMRLIQMLNVVDDELVVEEKGVNNIESFLMARRFMYWQVYLHKTTIAAEKMIESVLHRVRDLDLVPLQNISSALTLFLNTKISLHNLDNQALESFLELDDSDIWNALKLWSKSEDKVLSYLCKSIINRDLFRIRMSTEPFGEEIIGVVKDEIVRQFELTDKMVQYFLSSGEVHNAAYNNKSERIKIARAGNVLPLEEVSDLQHLDELGKIVKKYYLCYPKNVSLSHLERVK